MVNLIVVIDNSELELTNISELFKMSGSSLIIKYWNPKYSPNRISFEGFDKIEIENGVNINTSEATSLSNCFYDIKQFGPNILKDLTNWDVSKTKAMYAMFSGSNLNVDLANWDVSEVEDMSRMFEYSSINTNLNCWNLSSLLYSDDMFYNSKFNLLNIKVICDKIGFYDFI